LEKKLFQLHTAKERDKGKSLGAVGDGWMRIKKRKVHSSQKVEIIGTINVMTVYTK
jgi:hypothetical protein